MLLPKPFDVRDCQRKGRGIYAVVPIVAGALIESAPVLVLSAEDRARVAATRLRHYYFHWSGDEDGEWSAALALGHISLCNHAREPNAAFVVHRDQERIDLLARSDIAPGEEITIDYDCDLWFDILE
jgi:SET domain-containing protein